jgi:hypothetical protein
LTVDADGEKSIDLSFVKVADGYPAPSKPLFLKPKLDQLFGEVQSGGQS